jgi:hypothetical protein
MLCFTFETGRVGGWVGGWLAGRERIIRPAKAEAGTELDKIAPLFDWLNNCHDKTSCKFEFSNSYTIKLESKTGYMSGIYKLFLVKLGIHQNKADIRFKTSQYKGQSEKNISVFYVFTEDVVDSMEFYSPEKGRW